MKMPKLLVRRLCPHVRRWPHQPRAKNTHAAFLDPYASAHRRDCHTTASDYHSASAHTNIPAHCRDIDCLCTSYHHGPKALAPSRQPRAPHDHLLVQGETARSSSRRFSAGEMPEGRVLSIMEADPGMAGLLRCSRTAVVADAATPSGPERSECVV